MRLTRSDEQDKRLVALASALVQAQLEHAQRGVSLSWTKQRSARLDRAQVAVETFHAVSGSCR